MWFPLLMSGRSKEAPWLGSLIFNWCENLDTHEKHELHFDLNFRNTNQVRHLGSKPHHYWQLQNAISSIMQANPYSCAVRHWLWMIARVTVRLKENTGTAINLMQCRAPWMRLGADNVVSTARPECAIRGCSNTFVPTADRYVEGWMERRKGVFG